MTAPALISTDFDGTLIDHESATPFPPQLGELLSRFQANGGRWVINTGRTLWHTEEGITMFLNGACPNFVIASEREIYHATADGTWESDEVWNTRCFTEHERMFQESAPFLERCATWLRKHTRTQEMMENGVLNGIIAESEPEMERILEWLESNSHGTQELSWQRNMIYLRFCHRDYSKGSALGHLAGTLGLTPEQVFAAGDHHNDLSMLDGKYARMLACPVNAIEAVRKLVRQGDGMVSHARCGSGVLEALATLMPELAADLL